MGMIDWQVGCGNPDHPNGAWHPAASLPASWERRELRLQRQRQRVWGCGCPAIGRGITSDWRRGWRRQGDFLGEWFGGDRRGLGQPARKSTSRQYRVRYWINRCTDDRPEVARRASTAQQVLRWLLGTKWEV